MNVLVTGGDGLLGSHLVRGLLEKGYSVRVLVHPQSTSPTLADLPVEIVTGELPEDEEVLREAVRGCQFVFHGAAVTNIWADWAIHNRVNFEGTIAVLDACAAQGVERLICVGSASSFQFGPMERPGDEHGAFPRQYTGIPYMETKHRAAQRVREAVAQDQIDAVIVAPTFLLGAYDAGPSSGELIRQFLVRKMRFAPPGGRNFAYAPDVADAMLNAATLAAPGESYILGGENLKYFDFFSRVARAAGAPMPRFVMPAALVKTGGAVGSALGKITRKPATVNYRLASLSCLDTFYDASKARQQLQMPATSIDVAIKDALESLRHYGYLS